MNNKNIIIAGAIAIGLYLFSQTKKTPQKITQKIAQKVAQMDISEIPVQLLRYLIAHAAALKQTGKEVIALQAEVARREVVWKAAQKAAVRKAAAQKIGKKIGKKVAQR